MNQTQSPASDWLLHANKTLFPGAKGQFTAKNQLGKEILLEWESVDPLSSRFNEKIKEVRDILVETYTQIELGFSQKFPEAIPNEFFLKSLAPLFQEGASKIDWALIEGKIRTIFDTFFASTDFTKFSKENEVYVFVIAKDKTSGLPEGVVQFLINKDFPYGTVKACYFGISALQEEAGLEKILMSSIFKMLPETKRIFLHTRVSNTKAIERYLAWGFEQFHESMLYWPDFEYLTENSKALQPSF
jgi:hypothetical protein